MKIKRLSVHNLRIHVDKTLEFVENPTLILGPNGCGKTTLIEAIYIALRGKSFRGSDDAICRHGTDNYQIRVETDEHEYRVRYELKNGRRVKTFEVDGQKYARLPYRLKYPIVLFEPEDLRIVSGSPQRRRQFLDTLIQQYDGQYSRILSRYERALLQRNKLLKQPDVTRDDLFSWNVMLSEYGAKIIAERQAVAKYFDENITEAYRKIAKNEDEVSIYYSSDENTTSQQLLSQYEQKFEYDRVTGATSVGPHRHDLQIDFNGSAAAKVVSRGESRTIVLAVKSLEAKCIEMKTSTIPIILYDDVLSDLDKTRKSSLFNNFYNCFVILTSVDRK